jgi:plastocyanin
MKLVYSRQIYRDNNVTIKIRTWILSGVILALLTACATPTVVPQPTQPLQGYPAPSATVQGYPLPAATKPTQGYPAPATEAPTDVKPTATSAPTSTPAVTATPKTEFITFQDFEIVPASKTIAAGTKVVFLVKTNGTHCHEPYSSYPDRTDPSGLFDSGPLQNGESFEFTFTDPGTYTIRCGCHPDSMVGTITVTP